MHEGVAGGALTLACAHSSAHTLLSRRMTGAFPPPVSCLRAEKVGEGTASVFSVCVCVCVCGSLPVFVSVMRKAQQSECVKPRCSRCSGAHALGPRRMMEGQAEHGSLVGGLRSHGARADVKRLKPTERTETNNRRLAAICPSLFDQRLGEDGNGQWRHQNRQQRRRHATHSTGPFLTWPASLA